MQALDRSSTAEQIADRIREAIVLGRLRPNDRLIEQDLSSTFDVSRGPVREAIRLLASEGVVVLRKNRGAVVASPTLDDVLEVYALRLALGQTALELVAQSGACSQREHAGLVRLVARLRDTKVRADAQRMVEADLAFQSAAVELSGLPRFTEAFARTDTDIRVFVTSLGIAYDAQDHDHLANRHEALADVLLAGDAPKVAELWAAHINATVREFSRGFTDIERPALQRLLTADS